MEAALLIASVVIVAHLVTRQASTVVLAGYAVASAVFTIGCFMTTGRGPARLSSARIQVARYALRLISVTVSLAAVVLCLHPLPGWRTGVLVGCLFVGGFGVGALFCVLGEAARAGGNDALARRMKEGAFTAVIGPAFSFALMFGPATLIGPSGKGIGGVTAAILTALAVLGFALLMLVPVYWGYLIVLFGKRMEEGS